MPLPLSERTNTRENIDNNPLNSRKVTGKNISVSEIFDAYEHCGHVGLKHTLFAYMLFVLVVVSVCTLELFYLSVGRVEWCGKWGGLSINVRM
jgi:hypothetical protein